MRRKRNFAPGVTTGSASLGLGKTRCGGVITAVFVLTAQDTIERESAMKEHEKLTDEMFDYHILRGCAYGETNR